MKFEQVNWKSAYEWLERMQELLLEAYEKKDMVSVLRLQVSILKDFRTTAIAVRRVCSNKGSSTPGVDGLTVTTNDEREKLASRVHKIMRKPSTYKPSMVRRVWIPKGKTGKRPLGIPTILDRAIQAVYLEAVDPIVESFSCKNSYGFRKGRSAQDAVLALRGKLIHPKASEWVLKADITKCFDKINHEFLLRSIPVYRKVDRNVMKQMLKAKVIDQQNIITPMEGTPQGGVLSPALANIALNGLEETIKEKASELCRPILKRRSNPKVHVVRYADDFLVVGPSKKMLLALIPFIEEFLSERGLEISNEKSSIINLWESDVEFLGFSFRKRRFNYKKRVEISWYKVKSKSTSRIIILPSDLNQEKFKNKIRELIRKYSDLSTLILKLNEYLRGWANYFGVTSDSAECVRKFHQFVFRLCWLKVARLYPRLSKKRIRRKFFPPHKFYQHGRYVNRAWVFSAPTKLARPSSEHAKLRLFNLNSIKAPGKGIIRPGLNAYKKEERSKLKRSEIRFASGTIERVCKRQNFICFVCNQSLANGEDVEIHHLPSLKEVRLNLIPNKRVKLIALHKLCHRKVHKQ